MMPERIRKPIERMERLEDGSFPLMPQHISVRDKTAVDRSMMPRKASGLIFPLNKIVGECMGDRGHPLALAAGAGDLAVWGAAIKNPKLATALRVVTNGLDLAPIDWRKHCDEGKRTLDDIKNDLGKGIRQLEYPSGLIDAWTH